MATKSYGRLLEEAAGGVSGGAPGGGGFVRATSGSPLSSGLLNQNSGDAMAAAVNALPAGLVSGGACTASGLNVTIPSGTRYVARTRWTFDADQVVAVPDGATTYLWGCSDGVVRQTATTTFPTGYDQSSACILAKAVAASGVVTLDPGAAQWARAWDSNSRCWDNGGVWAPQPYVVSTGSMAVVPASHQQRLYGDVPIYGTLMVTGRLRVEE